MQNKQETKVAASLKQRYRVAARDQFMQNPFRWIRVLYKHTRYRLFGKWFRQLNPAPPARLLVICRARTGSNLLLTLLDAHPHIRQIWEPFDVESNSSRKPHMQQKGVLGYLEEILQRVADEKLICFKILYFQYVDNHAEKWGLPSLEPLRSYLEHDKNLKVIHLKRRNMLRSLVSNQIANKTHKYIIFNSRRRDFETQVELSPEQCEQEFADTKRSQQEFDDKFQGHKMLEIFYEDLVADTTNQCRRLQEFLEVKIRRLTGATVKQNIRPLADIVVNYEALKQHFASTDWSWMFDE